MAHDHSARQPGRGNHTTFRWRYISKVLSKPLNLTCLEREKSPNHYLIQVDLEGFILNILFHLAHITHRKFIYLKDLKVIKICST